MGGGGGGIDYWGLESTLSQSIDREHGFFFFFFEAIDSH